MRYVEMAEDLSGAVLSAHALGRCPTCGDWPDSDCLTYRHESPWRLVARGTMRDVDGFLAKVRVRGMIDISLHLAPGGFEDWRWIDRFEGGTVPERDAWIEHVRGLLAGHLRLRVYRDG